MPTTTAHPCPPLADPALIAEFRTAPVAVISDNLHRLPGASGLLPQHKGGVMVGTALTVKTRPGDNLAIHKALDLVQPGHVLVVDGGGDLSRALIGEIICAIAQSRGAAGIVIDGAIRDVATIRAGDFPCFARGVNHLGPYKDGPGHINVPVTVGGLVVQPGDIVVGDDDGVTAFPQAGAAELLQAVRQQEQREAEILASIREGRYVGAYAK